MIVRPFSEQLAGWQRDLWAQRALFGAEDVERIEAARRRVRSRERSCVYLVYENPFARGGGIFQVAANLPKFLAGVCRDVVVVSPFHAALRTADRRSQRSLGEFFVPFGGREVPAQVRELTRDGIRWLLLEAAGHFDAAGGPMQNNPYEHGGPGVGPVDSNARMRRDGLFAAAALPGLLRTADLPRDLVIHIQDWQLSPAALTVKQSLLEGTLESAAVLLTMHNPYDSGLPQEDLLQLTSRIGAERWPRDRGEARPAAGAAEDSPGANAVRLPRETFYECMLPITDAPISTVSQGYARELVSHPLQTVHFADHLQSVFLRQGMVGVNNGLFIAPRRAFSCQAESAARRGDVTAILEEKGAKRRRMLAVLSHYRPPQAIGWLSTGGSWDLTRLPDEVPVFLMFGRLDPGQKGFDVLTRAVTRLPANRAKFVITPIAPSGVEAHLRDLHDLAMVRPGDVLIYPFAMKEGYLETMAGASYCVMPSLHEPFGAATEPFLQGTPVVAHATGGLVQQVVDCGEDPQRGTGILFGELAAGDPRDVGRQWKGVLETAAPAQRVRHPVYVSLVNGLSDALSRGLEIFAAQPHAYGRMLAELHDQALRFDWRTSAAQYGQLYDLATGE